MKKIYFVLSFFLCTAGIAVAEGNVMEVVSAYREMMQVPAASIVVPTVVEVPLVYLADRRSFLVLDNQSKQVVPSYLHETYTSVPVPLSTEVLINGTATSDFVLMDKNGETGLEFLLPEDRRGSAMITVSAPTPISASTLTFDFSKNVLFAATIEVRAIVDGQTRIVLSQVPMTSERVAFIETVSDTWIISLTYAQPLVINELNLLQDDAEHSVQRGLRFLAQPGSTYTVYHNPDRSVSFFTAEQGDLANDSDVLLLNDMSTEMNYAFVPSDSDNDAVLDIGDNCVSVSNNDQIDIDHNGRGDACDDFDRDGRSNATDNCVNLPNLGQEDIDYDGIGDVCDTEESRFTERLPWVPWVGMGIAGAVLIGLFAIVAMRPMQSKSEEGTKH